MWQAPALTIVGQAFIPGVLTDRSVGWAIASVVSVAGVLASVAVAVALSQQRDREVLLSERIATEAKALGSPDPRRRGLREERGTPARCCIHPLEWPARWLWIGTIALLGVADVVALILTRV